MKSSELKQLIKEEIVSILSEDMEYRSFEKGDKVKAHGIEGTIVGNEARRGVLLYKIKDSKGNIKSIPSIEIDKINDLNEDNSELTVEPGKYKLSWTDDDESGVDEIEVEVTQDMIDDAKKHDANDYWFWKTLASKYSHSSPQSIRIRTAEKI